MGLALEVGILAELQQADPDGFEGHRSTLTRLNQFLVSEGLPPHDEPIDCKPWSGEMLGYSGLHDLRRLAAHTDCGRPLPAPGRGESSNDSCLEAYFEAAGPRRSSGALRKLFSRTPTFRRNFDHLILHSDAEGYYLPIDFPEVLFPPEELSIPGGIVGSAVALERELQQLVQRLEIPTFLGPDSEELWEASDSPTSTGPLWKRYGRESFGCVVLLHACGHAISSKAAIVFT